jgi:hypothetical protein
MYTREKSFYASHGHRKSLPREARERVFARDAVR